MAVIVLVSAEVATTPRNMLQLFFRAIQHCLCVVTCNDLVSCNETRPTIINLQWNSTASPENYCIHSVLKPHCIFLQLLLIPWYLVSVHYLPRSTLYFYLLITWLFIQVQNVILNVSCWKANVHKWCMKSQRYLLILFHTNHILYTYR